MAGAEASLESTKAQSRTAREAGQRRQLGLWVNYWQGVVGTKPVLQVRAPNVTFAERLTFHGPARSAELIAYVGGHTESDAVLFLPQEGIAFMSDLLFIGYQPYLGGGEPDKLRRILGEVSDLAPRLLVPGHGPVGTADSLKVMSQYVSTLDGLAREMVDEGESEETIDRMAVTEPYADWLFASFFPGNMHFLYARWLGERSGARTDAEAS
jgi:glyoxylase-like metal-dependent hydrolase (beta-lactamase superfamily II)